MKVNKSCLYATTLMPLVFLAACEQPEYGTRDRPCAENCQLTITLPDNESLPPEVSHDEYHAKGGAVIDIVLEGAPAPGGAPVTRLIFEAPDLAFVNASGNAIRRVTLNPGSNPTRLRPHGDGFCHPQDDSPEGCKYTVHSTGRPELDPYMIIYPR